LGSVPTFGLAVDSGSAHSTEQRTIEHDKFQLIRRQSADRCATARTYSGARSTVPADRRVYVDDNQSRSTITRGQLQHFRFFPDGRKPSLGTDECRPDVAAIQSSLGLAGMAVGLVVAL